MIASRATAVFLLFTAIAECGAVEPAGRRFDGPVILLTGFEPFGAKRPPNPSWESIKGLHGERWRGHRLVCKQLAVLWGTPLAQLEEWLDAYQPVAVFSFGAGGKGWFAIESQAANDRCRARDNAGRIPPRATIVRSGPRLLPASSDCAQLSQLLCARGHKTRVSQSAGQYLCEETLYSLEFLKLTRGLQSTVLFCHVPPLDSKIGAARVTAEFVQAFVRDVLEAWYTVSFGLTPVSLQTSAPPAQDTAQEKEVKEFIYRYFRTWSNRDIQGYNACFLPNACIQHIDAEGDLTTYPRSQFIASQANYHRTATHRATETAESIEIRFEANLARAVVYWKLVAGPREEWGYDHFTLRRHDGAWRIVNLVFYSTPKKD